MFDQEKIEEIDRYIIDCSISLLGLETPLVQPHFTSANSVQNSTYLKTNLLISIVHQVLQALKDQAVHLLHLQGAISGIIKLQYTDTKLHATSCRESNKHVSILVSVANSKMSLPATTEETSFIASIKSELKVRALTLFIDNSFVIAEPLALFEENVSKAPTLMFKNSSREILPPPYQKMEALPD